MFNVGGKFGERKEVVFVGVHVCVCIHVCACVCTCMHSSELYVSVHSLQV